MTKFEAPHFKKIASEVQVSICHNDKYLGIDLIGDDGKSYAHGHMDLQTAKKFIAFASGLIMAMESKSRSYDAIAAGVDAALAKGRT